MYCLGGLFMNNHVEIMAIVEGQTERAFMVDMLVPYLATKGIYLKPIVIGRPGHKGGDVRFARARNDIEAHLKQRSDTYLTLFVDYYGIRNDWPGLEEAKKQPTHEQKAAVFNQATYDAVEKLFGDHGVYRRFIPYVSMHEFEALLFSDPRILAEQLRVAQADVEVILTKCGEPEAINDSSMTAPSKRLANLSERFKKTSTGIAIAKAIGLPTMRRECPLFDAWLTRIENLRGTANG
jgi:hypothetical protein